MWPLTKSGKTYVIFKKWGLKVGLIKGIELLREVRKRFWKKYDFRTEEIVQQVEHDILVEGATCV